MQPAIQWNTRSSGRTQVRSAQVGDGKGKSQRGEERSFSGFVAVVWGRIRVTDGVGGADFEALCSFLLGFCLEGVANILPT